MIDAVLTASGKKKDDQVKGKDSGSLKNNKRKKNPVEWDLECEKIIRDRKEALKKLKKKVVERIGLTLKK